MQLSIAGNSLDSRGECQSLGWLQIVFNGISNLFVITVCEILIENWPIRGLNYPTRNHLKTSLIYINKLITFYKNSL